jgi:hypothetical protein
MAVMARVKHLRSEVGRPRSGRATYVSASHWLHGPSRGLVILWPFRCVGYLILRLDLASCVFLMQDGIGEVAKAHKGGQATQVWVGRPDPGSADLGLGSADLVPVARSPFLPSLLYFQHFHTILVPAYKYSRTSCGTH